MSTAFKLWSNFDERPPRITEGSVYKPLSSIFNVYRTKYIVYNAIWAIPLQILRYLDAKFYWSLTVDCTWQHFPTSTTGIVNLLVKPAWTMTIARKTTLLTRGERMMRQVAWSRCSLFIRNFLFDGSLRRNELYTTSSWSCQGATTFENILLLCFPFLCHMLLYATQESCQRVFR